MIATILATLLWLFLALLSGMWDLEAYFDVAVVHTRRSDSLDSYLALTPICWRLAGLFELFFLIPKSKAVSPTRSSSCCSSCCISCSWWSNSSDGGRIGLSGLAPLFWIFDSWEQDEYSSFPWVVSSIGCIFSGNCFAFSIGTFFDLARPFA